MIFEGQCLVLGIRVSLLCNLLDAMWFGVETKGVHATTRDLAGSAACTDMFLK